MFRPNRRKTSSPSLSRIKQKHVEIDQNVDVGVDVEANASTHGQETTPTHYQCPASVSTGTHIRSAKSISAFALTATSRTLMIPFLMCMVLFGIFLVTALGWWGLIFSPPVILVGWVVINDQNETHSRLIALGFVGAILCNQFPLYVSKALASASIAVFGLATIPNQQQQQQQRTNDKPIATEKNHSTAYNKRTSTTTARMSKLKFSRPRPSQWSGQTKTIAAVIGMTVMLLVENFFIWVVSATFTPSHEHDPRKLPKALQDNGRVLQTWFFHTFLSVERKDVQHLRSILNCQWALVVGLGVTLVCCELQLTRNSSPNNKHTVQRITTQTRTFWNVTLRVVVTLATARALRTVSFLLTVLPSQVPNCYTQHFPNPPPDTWIAWLLVGLLPSSHGGCNDLIVSGHATVTSVMACASTSVADNTAFSVALWTLVVIDYSVEVFEGFHYSVDMWMGALLTSLLWRIYISVEQEENHLQEQDQEDGGSGDDSSNTFHNSDAGTVAPESLPFAAATKQDIFWYVLPAAGAFVVITATPEAIINFWIVGYCVMAVVGVVQRGITSYTKHLLICALFIALASYL